MSDPIDFQAHRNRRSLSASKEAAVGALTEAVKLLLDAIPEINDGTFTREYDDLMLELSDALAPLEQFLIDELKPEHLDPP